jgi:diacylglycerol kinase family enzyme
MKRDRPFVVHIRAKDENGEVQGKSGGTVVFVPENENSYKVGWSICHPNDTYDKNLGIRISTGRAKAGNVVVRQPKTVENHLAMAHQIFIDILHRKEHIDAEDRMDELDLINWVTDYANMLEQG